MMVAACYGIYILVSFFRSENFLFLLDAMLAIGVFFAITSRSFSRYTLRHGVVLLSCIGYAITVLLAWLVLSEAGSIEAMKTLRNLLYCVGVFIVALTYVTNRVRLERLVQVMAFLTVLSALYGLRQAIFGYWDFELERLAKMGSSLGEMLTLGRARLTSTFGDPLLCGFYMMAGLFVLRARRNLSVLPFKHRLGYGFGGMVTFVVLVATLTRAPLLGFFVGAGLVFAVEFQLTWRNLRRLLVGTSLVVSAAATVTAVFSSGILADSENGTLRFLDAAVGSVWSLLVLFAEANDDETYFLVGQSRDQRLVAWGLGLDFLGKNPLGAGFTSNGMFPFALGDTGILQVPLLIGIPGFFAFLSMLTLPLFSGVRQLQRTRERRDRQSIAAFLGFWIAFGITTGISSLATSSAVAIVAWLFGAVLVNARIIFTPREGDTAGSGA
jgi:hypothetical protein